jgi:hypothetical protein
MRFSSYFWAQFLIEPPLSVLQTRLKRNFPSQAVRRQIERAKYDCLITDPMLDRNYRTDALLSGRVVCTNLNNVTSVSLTNVLLLHSSSSSTHEFLVIGVA